MATLQAQRPLITLVGPPGVGKSHLLTDLLERWSGATAPLLCHLDSIGSLAKALEIIAHTIALPVANASVGAIAAALVSRASTLVLDGVDDLLPELSRAIPEWLHATPILMAVQEPLGVPYETVVDIAPLAQDGAPLALLRSFLVHHRPSLSAEITDEQMAALAWHFGDLPLSLIAAASAVAQEPMLLLQQQSVTCLWDRVLRSTLVRGTLDPVWSRLHEEEREVLVALSVFSGSFTPAAAADLLAEHPCSVNLNHHLSTLLRRSLVLRERGALRLIPLVREDAAQHGNRSAVRMRHIHYTARQADIDRESQPSVLVPRRKQITGADCLAALRSITLATLPTPAEAELVLKLLAGLSLLAAEDIPEAAEIEHLHAALLRCARYASSEQVAAALLSECHLWLYRRAWHQAEPVLRAVLDRLPIGHPLCVWAYAYQGEVHRQAWRNSDAAAVFVGALGHNPPPPLRVWILCRLAIVLVAMGQTDEADEALREAGALAILHNDVGLIGAVDACMGTVALERRQLESSRAHFQRAAQCVQELGLHDLGLVVTAYLGVIEWEAGRPEEAEELLKRALTAARLQRHRAYQVLTCAVLGALWAAQGRFLEAHHSIHHARALCHGEPVLTALVSLYAEHLELAECRRLRDLSMEDVVQRRWLNLEERLQRLARERVDKQGPMLLSISDDVRIALRALRRAIENIDVPQPRAAPAPLSAAAPLLRLCPEASWFQRGDQAPVSLRGRPVLQRILRCLARSSQTISTAELIAVAWPGQHIPDHVAYNRLYVSISELRRLGLGAVLVNKRGCYSLSAEVVIHHPQATSR